MLAASPESNRCVVMSEATPIFSSATETTPRNDWTILECVALTTSFVRVGLCFAGVKFDRFLVHKFSCHFVVAADKRVRDSCFDSGVDRQQKLLISSSDLFLSLFFFGSTNLHYSRIKIEVWILFQVENNDLTRENWKFRRQEIAWNEQPKGKKKKNRNV